MACSTLALPSSICIQQRSSPADEEQLVQLLYSLRGHPDEVPFTRLQKRQCPGPIRQLVHDTFSERNIALMLLSGKWRPGGTQPCLHLRLSVSQRQELERIVTLAMVWRPAIRYQIAFVDWCALMRALGLSVRQTFELIQVVYLRLGLAEYFEDAQSSPGRCPGLDRDVASTLEQLSVQWPRLYEALDRLGGSLRVVTQLVEEWLKTVLSVAVANTDNPEDNYNKLLVALLKGCSAGQTQRASLRSIIVCILGRYSQVILQACEQGQKAVTKELQALRCGVVVDSTLIELCESRISVPDTMASFNVCGSTLGVAVGWTGGLCFGYYLDPLATATSVLTWGAACTPIFGSFGNLWSKALGWDFVLAANRAILSVGGPPIRCTQTAPTWVMMEMTNTRTRAISASASAGVPRAPASKVLRWADQVKEPEKDEENASQSEFGMDFFLHRDREYPGSDWFQSPWSQGHAMDLAQAQLWAQQQHFQAQALQFQWHCQQQQHIYRQQQQQEQAGARRRVLTQRQAQVAFQGLGLEGAEQDRRYALAPPEGQFLMPPRAPAEASAASAASGSASGSRAPPREPSPPRELGGIGPGLGAEPGGPALGGGDAAPGQLYHQEALAPELAQQHAQHAPHAQHAQLQLQLQAQLRPPPPPQQQQQQQPPQLPMQDSPVPPGPLGAAEPPALERRRSPALGLADGGQQQPLVPQAPPGILRPPARWGRREEAEAWPSGGREASSLAGPADEGAGWPKPQAARKELSPSALDHGSPDARLSQGKAFGGATAAAAGPGAGGGAPEAFELDTGLAGGFQ